MENLPGLKEDVTEEWGQMQGVGRKTPKWNRRLKAACPPCEERGCRRKELAEGRHAACDSAEGSLYRECLVQDFALLLNMTDRRGTKANMANTGPCWLESWILPLASAVHEVLGEDF